MKMKNGIGLIPVFLIAAQSSALAAETHYVNVGETFSKQLSICAGTYSVDQNKSVGDLDALSLTESGLFTFELKDLRNSVLSILCTQSNDVVKEDKITIRAVAPPVNEGSLSLGKDACGTFDLSNGNSPFYNGYKISSYSPAQYGTPTISGTVLTYCKNRNRTSDALYYYGTINGAGDDTTRKKISITMEAESIVLKDVVYDAPLNGVFTIDFNTLYNNPTIGGNRLITTFTFCGQKPSQGTATVVSYGSQMQYVFDPENVSGSDTFEYCLRDNGNNQTSPAKFTVNFAAAPVEIELPTLTLESDVSKNFVQKLSASGGVAPYSYLLTSGALPTGLAISGDEITGTPTVDGTFNFDVTATDANGATGTRSYSMTVAASYQQPTATDATYNLRYGESMTVDLAPLISGDWDFIDKTMGDASDFSYEINGTVLTAHSLSGNGFTPERQARYALYPKDYRHPVASGTITFNIEATAPVASDFSVAADNSGYIDIDFGPHLQKGSLDILDVTWEGILVSPIRFEQRISPTVIRFAYDLMSSPNDYVIRWNAQDTFGHQSNSASVTVSVPAAKFVTVTGQQLTGKVGQLFENEFAATGGVAPYTFTVMSGLPDGLTFKDGKIEGTPTAEGSSFVFVRVVDSEGTIGTGLFNLTIAAADAILPNVANDAQISVQRGGNVTHTFAHDFFAHVVDGDVYAEQLNIKSVSDPRVQLSGQLRPHPTYITVPIAALGTVSVQYSVTDVNGVESNTATLQIELSDPDFMLDVLESAKPKIGELYGVDFSAWGAAAPFTYVVTGTWPDEMAWEEVYNTQNTASFALRGTPTKQGVYNFTVTITDANGFSKSAQHTIDLGGSVSLPALTLAGKVGNAFSQDFVATGGVAPYAYDLIGTLPNGLSFSGNSVSGTPTVDGTFSFDIKVTDANGLNGTQTYTMTVSPADEDVEAPTAKIGTIVVEYGQSGSVDLSKLVTGKIDTYELGVPPTKGTVKFAGSVATYTPYSGETGTDAFSYYANNSVGWATATVAVSIKAPLGEVPVAKDHIVRLQPTQSGAVNLTDGAISQDPILQAHVLNSLPASTGLADVSGTRLGFDPHKAFAGSATVSYQLENRWGKSNIAKVTFVVAERPDPSKDPEVAALIKAQKDAGTKLSFDQVDNITRRIEQIRGEAPGARQNSFDWQLGVDSKDNARYDHDGNEVGGKNSANARGSFTSENPLAGWTTGYIRLGETDFGGIDLKSTAVGGTAGLDYRFNDQFVGGVALGYGREATKIGENGTENVAQAISGALYGTWHNQSGAFVDGILGFSHLTMDSSRYVTSTGDMAYGSRSGSTIFGSVVGGYRFETESGLKFEPYAGFRGVVGKLNGFTETGADWNNLAYGTTDIRSLKAVAGIRLEKDYETEDFLITPSFKAEYRHELAGGTTTALGYADLGTMPYSVTTEASDSNSVVASVGVRVKPKDSALSVEAAAQANISGSGKPTMTYSVRASMELCGLSFSKVDCMSREEKVAYYKQQLAKAELKKDLKKVAEFTKLLAEAEAKLDDWNRFSATLTPVPDFNTQFIDTISGPKPTKSKVQKPRTAKKKN